MQSIALIALAISMTQDNLPNYPCASIKTSQSCAFMPGCQFDDTQEKCLGVMKRLPRFVKEFKKDTRFVFPTERLLASPNLEGIALHRKSLAEYINTNKTTDLHVLDTPDIGVTTKRNAQKEQREKEVPAADLAKEPSPFEEHLTKLSKETGLSVADLRKSDSPLVSLLEYDRDTTLEKIELFGLTLKEAILLKNIPAFNVNVDVIKLLISKAKLTPKQILAVTDAKSSLLWEANKLAECISTGNLTWAWFTKLRNTSSIYYGLNNCKNLETLRQQFALAELQLTTNEGSLQFLASAKPAHLFALNQKLGLSLKFLIKNQISRNDISTINSTMKKFELTAEQAVTVSPAWNTYALQLAKERANQLNLPLLSLLQLDPKPALKPAVLESYRLLNVDPKEIIAFGLSDLSHPEAFKSILSLWKSNSALKSLNFSVVQQIKRISDTPKRMESFEKDWKIYQPYGNFDDFLSSYEDSVSAGYKARLIFDRVILGDVQKLSVLPFLSEPTLMFDDERGPVFVYAKKLGYEDVVKFLDRFAPKTIRVTRREGRREFALPVGKDAFTSSREVWHLPKIKYEPTNFSYFKEVGRLIVDQAEFWHATDLKDVNIFESHTVADSLENYKSAGFINMASYTTKAKHLRFPFVKKAQIPEQINGSNFAILLAPKAEFDMTVFRGQGCEKRWVTTPFRFWSTSASAEFAKNWAVGKCVLEIRIPKGFPAFFLNIASMVNAGEHEFLLPSHALNKKGKLVPVHYDIIEEAKNKTFLASEYDSEHDLEYQLQFDARSYFVRPASDLMVYDESEGTFADYEKRYTKQVCAEANLTTKSNGFEYLKQMCESSQKWLDRNQVAKP